MRIELFPGPDADDFCATEFHLVLVPRTVRLLLNYFKANTVAVRKLPEFGRIALGKAGSRADTDRRCRPIGNHRGRSLQQFSNPRSHFALEFRERDEETRRFLHGPEYFRRHNRAAQDRHHANSVDDWFHAEARVQR